jgi:predicted phage baseplate assembly protein
MPGEVIGISNGEPGQRFAVRSHPVLDRRHDETVRVFADGQYFEWIEVEDFLNSDHDDRHFTWSSATGEIRFGPRIRRPDGSTRQHGAVPPFGAEVAVTQYRTGGGAKGNVGAGTLRKIRSAMPYVAAVENLTAASGGVDSETVENAKLRGPDILRRGHQLITSDDYERLVLENEPSVARVACVPPVLPGEPVRVLVVPRTYGPPHHQVLDDFALPVPLVDRLIEVIDERRVLGVTAEVGTPYYQGVTVAALLRARPGRPLDVVRARALESLSAFINPISGGRDGRGWPFGEDLSSAVLFSLLESVDGVERVDEVLLFEFDLRQVTRIGHGKEIIRLTPDSLFLSAHHQVVVR